ncbi:hypothetical protein D9758_009431 [Tetrapyrgos nigripes]|uniref:Uncharacterized protein n=1 Tax=Tetrapyrgos nigripes TaxID=182062 RepID=A0A8H5D4E5_9AGAR|nr:hypothetical protein D9758_009431 [Tetrapyrgos nigripes]
MYKPVVAANPIVQAVEPFSTSLGIPICNADTPHLEGTDGLFFADPGKLYLLTTRHVLFHPDNEPNELYKYREDSGQPRRKVLLLGEAAFKDRLKAIESETGGKQIIIDQFNRRLNDADEMENKEDAEMEREMVLPLLEQAKNAIESSRSSSLMSLENGRTRRSVSSATSFCPRSSVSTMGTTASLIIWAVVEIDSSMIDRFSFVGNVIDLGTSIPVDELTTSMYPRLSNPTLFNYPENRLLKFHGLSQTRRCTSLTQRPKTRDQDDDPVTMVLQNGCTSKLTIGPLNTIRSATREYFQGKAAAISKEVAVLSRTSKSKPFSKCGDSDQRYGSSCWNNHWRRRNY